MSLGRTVVALLVAAAAVAAGAWDLLDPPSAPEPLAVVPEGPLPRHLERAVSAWDDDVVVLVNQERAAVGRPPLKKAAELDAAASGHSDAMAIRDFFAHCDLDTGASPWARITAAGYQYSSASENIAAGYGSPAAVMAGWMSSAGHRANILSPDVREIGVGYAYQAGDLGNVRRDLDGNCVADDFDNGPYVHYWTQNFGARSGVYPVVIDGEAVSTPDRDVELYLYGSGWAGDMRIRNAGGTWTPWQPFVATVAWQLEPGTGLRQVDVELRSGVTVRSASDTIHSEDTSDVVFEDGFESGGPGAWSDAFP